MINRPIETYKQLVRAKAAYDFAQLYDIDNVMLNYIYDFTESPQNKVVGDPNSIKFYVNGKLVKTVNVKMKESEAKYYKSVNITGGEIGYVWMPNAFSSESSSSYTSPSQ